MRNVHEFITRWIRTIPQRFGFFITVILIILPFGLFGADFDLFHADQFELLFVATHQGSDQIGGSGMGGGVNILTKYQIYPKKFICFGTEQTTTRDCFYLKNQ